MAKVKPFKAVVYSQNRSPDISRLVCPPYDVISFEKQRYYHDLDSSNFIHILLGMDIPGEDKYRRAGENFRQWLKDGILSQEEQPAVYYYIQEFKVMGEKKARRGFIALLHLGEGKSSAFGHENTHREAKEDRLKLIRQVKANLSPIFAIFVDKKRLINNIYEHAVKDRLPFIDITDDEGVSHKLWRIDSPQLLSDIESKMVAEDIFIADGHHRYEVAQAYRQELRDRGQVISEDDNRNYILSYFTNTDARGLEIMPIHRLVRLKREIGAEELISKLKVNFDIEEIRDKARFFFLLRKGGRSEHLMGMYRGGRFWLVRLKNVKILDREFPDKPKEYSNLDVAVLNSLILEKALRIDLQDKEALSFSHNAEELITQVNQGDARIAFFLNPVAVEQIIALALKGEKMPPKSTYFYPKVLSGLVINKFNSEG